MRIYNAKNSQIDLPCGGVRLTIQAKGLSRDFMPSEEFLNLIAASYERTELALIVGGPFEMNMCAKNAAVTDLVVQSIDEAIQRFNPTPVKVMNPTPVKEEVKVEEPVKEPEPEVEPEVESEPEPEKEVESEPEEEVVVAKVRVKKGRTKKEDQ
jgi:outer membrane biosynthesis protein TonB